jgi:glutamate 5-kinase
MTLQQLSKTKMDAAKLYMQVGLPWQITQSRNKRTLTDGNPEQQKQKKFTHEGLLYTRHVC